MTLSIIMMCLSSISVVIATATNRKAHFGRVKIHLYWVMPMICAVVLLATKTLPIKILSDAMFGDSAMNPLKILALFISMSALSVYLDKVGFFKYLASKVIRHAGTSQLKLFILLYLIIALVTLFTSNSTIVLTFTPFICYFAKHSGINPVPFLFMEFVAANTWSMFILIGNATNVFIATSFGVTFTDYIMVMALPTVLASAVSFVLLLLIFRKDLRAPLTPSDLDMRIRNRPALIVGIIGLGACTSLLAASSYIGIEMWLICLVAAFTVLLLGTFCLLAKKQSLLPIHKTLRRLPWHLVPFLISMFVIILSLTYHGVNAQIASVFDNKYTLLSFGTLSAACSNLMNNLPMSMFFVGILSSLSPEHLTAGLYATVIGSNMGSLFTPIASMSAIMWLSIIKHKEINFKFKDFVKHGILIVLPTLAAALGGLALMLYVIM